MQRILRAHLGVFCLCCLAVGTALALPQRAAACSGICQNVAPPGQFCRRCMDAGTPTGALCQDSGACGCFYIQCATGQVAAVGEVDWNDLVAVQALATQVAGNDTSCVALGEADGEAESVPPIATE